MKIYIIVRVVNACTPAIEIYSQPSHTTQFQKSSVILVIMDRDMSKYPVLKLERIEYPRFVKQKPLKNIKKNWPKKAMHKPKVVQAPATISDRSEFVSPPLLSPPLPLSIPTPPPTPPTSQEKETTCPRINLSRICEDREDGAFPAFGSIYNYVIPAEITKNEPSMSWMENPAIPPPNVKPRILSVVASVRFGCDLNLRTIAEKMPDLHFSKYSFTPLKMLLREPYAVGMVFASGNMVVTGTTSEAECRVAVHKFRKRIRLCGFPVISRPTIQIQNITATLNTGFRIRLHDLSKCELLKGRVFVNENFSGLTVELTVPHKAKIIVFQTGRVLITGVTAEKDVQEALNFIYPFAKMYAK